MAVTPAWMNLKMIILLNVWKIAKIIHATESFKLFTLHFDFILN